MTEDYTSFITDTETLQKNKKTLLALDGFLTTGRGIWKHYGIAAVNLRDLTSPVPAAYLKLTRESYDYEASQGRTIQVTQDLIRANTCTGIVADLITTRSFNAQGLEADFMETPEVDGVLPSHFQRLLNHLHTSMIVQKHLTFPRQTAVADSYLRALEFFFDIGLFPRTDKGNYALILDHDPANPVPTVLSICSLADSRLIEEAPKGNPLMSTQFAYNALTWGSHLVTPTEEKQNRSDKS